MRGFTFLQTDDTSGAEKEIFLEKSSKIAKMFDCKLRKVIKVGESVTLNGAYISSRRGMNTKSQQDHLERVRTIPEDKFDLVAFVSQSGRNSYVASDERLDFRFGLALASQVLNLEEKYTKTVDNCVLRAKKR